MHQHEKMINLFRRLTGNPAAAPGFAIFYACQRIAAGLIATAVSLGLCPMAAAQLTGSISPQAAVGLDTIYYQYTVQLWAGLAVLILVIALTAHLIRTQAKLARSFWQARQITQQLKQSTDKLTYMIATSPTVLFAMRVNKDRLSTHWISDNLTRITGYTLEEALAPLWWKQHLDADERERMLMESKALFSGKHLTYEYRFIHKNGQVMWIQDEQQLVCDESGKPTEVLSAWTDITERKLEEINLRIAATAFETKEGIIITDKNNRIIRVNSSFTRLTGYSTEEAIGPRTVKFRPP